MKQVPFYSNTVDDTHCVQAVFRMVLKNFLPSDDFEWETLDKISHKVPGLGTWWFPATLKFRDLGFDVKYIELFDYQQYYQQGADYLTKFYGKEIANWFIKNSNLAQVKSLIPNFIKVTELETRAATLQDIDDLLSDGWLVGVEINARVLQQKPGFNGHMILIYDSHGDDYIVHDPGLPAQPARRIAKATFTNAWCYAGESKTSLIAWNMPSNN